ncbi:MAG: hypothetical protein HC876_16980 [Chloroflexaceae bacterium]|nr:hypothetical protein [Chloroflexaceae bacterium]
MMRYILLLCLIGLLLVGCASTPDVASEEVYTVVQEGTIAAGDAVPAPQAARY